MIENVLGAEWWFLSLHLQGTENASQICGSENLMSVREVQAGLGLGMGEPRVPVAL